MPAFNAHQPLSRLGGGSVAFFLALDAKWAHRGIRIAAALSRDFLIKGR